ncbi:MAG: hypothetical protein GC204_07125 [Chloroflexi bacterium]|nr:hypothetical protein [Chloroflexota bacterium]
MNLQVEWDNPEKTIIRITYTERWTWSDFYEANAAAIAMMNSVPHTVHFLADFRQSRSLPLGGAITHARSALSNMPDNWGLLVIVSTSTLIQRMVTIFQTAFGGKMGLKTCCVTSIDAAYRLIAQPESESSLS